MKRMIWRGCAAASVLVSIGCGGEAMSAPMDDAGLLADASDASQNDGSVTVAPLVPTTTHEGAWTIEQFDTLTIDAVEIAADESGNVALAVARADRVSVLTPHAEGYLVRDIEDARGPISLALNRERIVVKYSGLNNIATLAELSQDELSTQVIDSQIDLRALSTTSVAFAPSRDLLVLADTLDLTTHERSIVTYNADIGWQSHVLLSFVPAPSTEPVVIDSETMNDAVAMLTDHEGTLTFYENALSAESSMVATLHSAASLCVQNGAPRVIAADAHGTGFPDRLRVFDRNGEGTWTSTELESSRAYSQTSCAATASEMVIVDTSTTPLLVRGGEVRRLESFGDLRARPRVIAVGDTIHFVWSNGNQQLMHATADGSAL